MEAIYVTDLHISGRNPLCRLDDLTSTQFNKLIQLVNISNELKVPIICGADVFEQPNIAYSVYSQTASILSKCEHGFYTIFGNHDLQYHSLDNWDATALGALLSSSKTVKHISSFSNDYGIGIDWIDWTQKEPEVFGDNKSKILLCHKAIVSKKIMKFWQEFHQEDFSLYSSKYIRDYSLILCGHYHKQYTIKTDDTTVINTGCFTRRKATDVEKHLPSYALVDLKKFTFKIYPLPKVKPWEEVISEDHLIITHDNKSLEIKLQEFVKLIKSKRKDVSNFLNDLLNFMKDADEDVKEELRKILLKLFGEKMEYIILEKRKPNEIKRFTNLKRKS